MTENNVEHLLPVQNEIGETPIWVAKEQALYWIDCEGNKVYRFDATTGEYQTIDVAMAITGLYPRASGGWITATKTGIAFWEHRTNEFTFIVDPEADTPQVCCNDAVVDRQGRFLVGTMNEQDFNASDGSLYRLDTNGSLHSLDSGFAICNGMGLSLDGRTLYLTDMFHYQILAYDYDFSTGNISHQRPFVRVPEETGAPDGLIVDSEDFIWSAHWGGWRITRYDPAGKIEREIRLPVANVTCLGFGGADLDELYVTTAWSGLSKQERKKQPLAGDLFRIKTEIKGMPESEFLG
ncbi:MAG TPA: SMP-30/gluconolactonase/LRE family protein [Desulfobacterales bacterium]|nr:SMP-30/gluconolactonase/LRE family protein [Desulfobacterales bacterium]